MDTNNTYLICFHFDRIAGRIQIDGRGVVRFVEDLVDDELAVEPEERQCTRDAESEQVQEVPNAVFDVHHEAHRVDLEQLFDRIVHDERDEHDETDVRHRSHLAGLQQVQRAELPRRHHAAGRRELGDQLGHHEQVQVRIVGGEVDKDDARAAINPQVLLERLENLSRGDFVESEIDDVAAVARVSRDLAPHGVLGERLDLGPREAGVVAVAGAILEVVGVRVVAGVDRSPEVLVHDARVVPHFQLPQMRRSD